jgi:hypothetical protein
VSAVSRRPPRAGRGVARRVTTHARRRLASALKRQPATREPRGDRRRAIGLDARDGRAAPASRIARQVATAPACERPPARSTSPGAASLAASRRMRAVVSQARSNASRQRASLAAIGGEQSASMGAAGALRPQAAWRAMWRRRPRANVRPGLDCLPRKFIDVATAPAR